MIQAMQQLLLAQVMTLLLVRVRQKLAQGMRALNPCHFQGIFDSNQ